MKIAVLGCGTVAQGVFRLLVKNETMIRERVGEPITVSKVLARHPEKAYALGFDEDTVVTTFDPILQDPDISLIVELIGGTNDAFTYVSRALTAGKHVVTANKDLLALHPELIDLADAHHVCLMYEASVAGGIPLLGPIERTLAANRIQSIYGILNGTTNYILSRMVKEGLSYARILKDAQALGFAEADPTSDVEGADAARKLAILSSLAFRTRITYPQVHHEGITGVTQTDIRFAARQGYTPKLLAVTKEEDGTVEVFVRPALIPSSHPLASVSDAFNAVFLRGDAVGEIMLYGKGAGGDPTASSVVGDIMEVCLRAGDLAGKCNISSRTSVSVKTIKPMDDTNNVYYIRLLVADRPNVLAKVAGALGEQGISIAELVQEPHAGSKTDENPDGMAELMLLTHKAGEKALKKAIGYLLGKDYIEEIHTMIVLSDL